MSLIAAREVTKIIPAIEGPLSILKGVSLEINRGETIAIKGASGSGKTTLLSILAGLDEPTTGAVFFDGVAMSTLSEDDRSTLRKGNMAFVFQQFELIHTMSALENVVLPLEIAGYRDAREKAESALARVGLAHRLSHYPNQLSGGEQQRVAIARAYAVQPHVIFADEPTGFLDEDTGNKIISLLFTLSQEAGTTLVLVTHDKDLAKRCGRTYTLVHGKVEETFQNA